eukprot:gene34886-41023_t
MTAPSAPRPADEKIRCDACPVACYIRDGMVGACDRYANRGGALVRVDPHVVLERSIAGGRPLVPFAHSASDWDGALIAGGSLFVTAVGA